MSATPKEASNRQIEGTLRSRGIVDDAGFFTMSDDDFLSDLTFRDSATRRDQSPPSAARDVKTPSRRDVY